MDGLLLIVAILALVGIFATTRTGRALLVRTRLRDRIPGAAPREDVDYLISLCGGDANEASRRVEAERAQVPDLPEAQHYRRAIRKSMAAARD